MTDDTTDGQTLIRFAAQTLANKSVVLATMKVSPSCDAELWINCERMVVGSMLAKEIKQHLED